MIRLYVIHFGRDCTERFMVGDAREAVSRLHRHYVQYITAVVVASTGESVPRELWASP